MKDDVYFMQCALNEAVKGKETAPPNPMVGAVIVEEDDIVAVGHHVRPGEAHAERIALKNLNRAPGKDARMYVTLEPCSTAGRTGKCTDAIIKSGLTHIVIGAIDPNPLHRGQGIDFLKQAGIKVTVGVLEQECEALNPEFNERMKDGENI